MKQCRTAYNGSASAALCAERILEVIPAVMRVIRTEMRRKTAAEMSVVQFRALALSDYRGGATVSEVAEHIGLTAPSASKLIEGLVRRGYLRRRPDPTDRRKSIVVATVRGARAVQAARQTTARHIAGMLGEAPVPKLAVMAGGLEALGKVFLGELAQRPPSRAGRLGRGRG
jgi:MarR family transcriptional regulator for hemolysin